MDAEGLTCSSVLLTALTAARENWRANRGQPTPNTEDLHATELPACFPLESKRCFLRSLGRPSRGIARINNVLVRLQSVDVCRRAEKIHAVCIVAASFRLRAWEGHRSVAVNSVRSSTRSCRRLPLAPRKLSDFCLHCPACPRLHSDLELLPAQFPDLCIGYSHTLLAINCLRLFPGPQAAPGSSRSHIVALPAVPVSDIPTYSTASAQVAFPRIANPCVLYLVFAFAITIRPSSCQCSSSVRAIVFT
jgi:hypothetical protein